MSPMPPARTTEPRWCVAQAGRRNQCDVCRRAIPVGARILYWRPDDHNAYVLCEADGKRKEDRDGARYKDATTKEARGQTQLDEAPAEETVDLTGRLERAEQAFSDATDRFVAASAEAQEAQEKAGEAAAKMHLAARDVTRVRQAMRDA